MSLLRRPTLTQIPLAQTPQARLPLARFPLALIPLTVIPLALPLTVLAADPAPQARSHNSHDSHGDSHSNSSTKRDLSPLVQKVRRATSRFRDINVAIAEGWKPGTPCVSGPNSGAMGVHFILGERMDGVANADEPEALIYEPLPGGAYRLVGVEYIVPVDAMPKDAPPPVIDGHLTHYVGAPNRYGALGAFYELHVWAWENNPNGTFADWNTKVTCDRQLPPM
jgi:hypothetical protein